ncbi:putative haloacid-halidohydrolase [Hortaea werneckii]|nr:putative haloacid-halidohydrolase [Hortaea werneckii]KAI7616151.1 putative haloacid-halidohydrolase [Hortaea werneckii]KAI7633792.1 putative haloacid-halidohydrolase [Hortaea werneckii]KAI7668996.1 putative haloacid-halidohydrolase [Hortaea werneckii]KAI7705740.1 putative haloacid-halidohydrolase [Hortaea werneckii]
MDGLLIDSEDLYTHCTNTVLHEHGKPSLPWHIKAQLQGRPGPSAGKIFQEWAQLPISNEELMRRISELQRGVFPGCKALPGVEALLASLSQARVVVRKREGSEAGVVEEEAMEIALATSSHQANYELKTQHLQPLMSVFPASNRILGDDPRIPPGRGKPAPDIYLLALETINARRRAQQPASAEILPAECLVFEDSVPGVEAGRRAGMQVVWVPHPGLRREMEGREGEILAGRMGTHEEVEAKDREIGTVVGGGEEEAGKRKEGASGEVGDGWGRFLETLEGFPYAEYGIRVPQ